MNSNDFLGNIYQVKNGESMRQAYDQWAAQYDADIKKNQYQTPTRVAQALARHLSDLKTPVLDFACGTGLSGQALQAAGFTCIDGIDLSEKMLNQALQKNVYRHLSLCKAQAPFNAALKPYQVIAAVGAIGAGAAPVECLSQAIAYLPPEGLLCVSLNDHTLEDPRYEAVITDAVANGTVEVLENEHGEHLPEIQLGARIYVLLKQR